MNGTVDRILLDAV